MEDFEKFFNSSLRFLSFRSRSEKEVIDNLKKKKVSTSVIEKIIQKLKELKFLDDNAFAKLWIEQRTQFKPRSLRLIKMELKQKGISEEIIEYQISNIQYPISNVELAKKLAEKKIKRLNLSDEKDRQKLQRFLMSKGFDWDTIKEVIKIDE